MDYVCVSNLGKIFKFTFYTLEYGLVLCNVYFNFVFCIVHFRVSRIKNY